MGQAPSGTISFRRNAQLVKAKQGKETGNDGSPRVILLRAGNTSITTPEASGVTGSEDTGTPFHLSARQREEFQNEKEGWLSHVAAKWHSTFNSTLSNSTQNLKVSKELRAIRKRQIPMWCARCKPNSVQRVSAPHTAPLRYSSDNDPNHLPYSGLHHSR